MSVWLLVPVKRLAAGKGRLRGWLDEAGRLALNEFLLRRTLAIASVFPGAARTLVVSDCEETLGVAASFRVRTLLQRSGAGLNCAVHDGIEALRCFGAERLMILLTDLPMVLSTDLERLAEFVDTPGRTVLCPDKHGIGTNALAMPANARMQMRFGEGSLIAHYREALCAGLVPRVWHHPRIALDIDTPEDLTRWTVERRTAGPFQPAQ